MGVDNTAPVQYTGGVPAYVPPPVTAPHYPAAAATTTTSTSSNRPQYAPGPPLQPQYAPPAAVAPQYVPSGASPYPPQQTSSSSPYPPQCAPAGGGASPYPPQVSPYPPSTAPSAQDAGVDQIIDDDFVLVNDVPAKRPCDDPSYLPPPTAPPAPSQPQPPGNPSVAQAYATVSAAIVADKSGNIDEAVAKFKSGIALLNWCDRQGLFPRGDVEGIHQRVRQYQSRLDELERNARYTAQPQQAAKKPAAAKRPSGGGGAGFGWDGTGFSGSRRRQLDTALELREQAELFLERGKLLEAKGRLMGCAEALLGFASTETDAKLKREVRKEAEDIIDQAEMLQDEVACWGGGFAPSFFPFVFFNATTHTQLDDQK